MSVLRLLCSGHTLQRRQPPALCADSTTCRCPACTRACNRSSDKTLLLPHGSEVSQDSQGASHVSVLPASQSLGPERGRLLRRQHRMH
jgi:hypothetical protein